MTRTGFEKEVLRIEMERDPKEKITIDEHLAMLRLAVALMDEANFHGYEDGKDLMDTAWEDGFAEGYAEGYSDGLDGRLEDEA